MEFFIDMKPPTVTAQEHKVMVRHGKPMFYDTAKLKEARSLFTAALRLHKPEEPFSGPVALTVAWYFFSKIHQEGTYRTTRPDTDNLEKLLKDCMTAVGFWKDDSQVCVENVIKCWSHKKTRDLYYCGVFR